MNVLLDILGATLIGGIVFMAMMNLNIYTSQVKYSSDSELTLQRNAKTLAEIINNDLRKVGYRHTGAAIISAQEKFFEFYADIDSNGTSDVISYSLGDTSDALATTNPNDKVLIRTVNNISDGGPSLGITNLKFRYFNTTGQETAALDSIKYIKSEIWIETTDMVDAQYPFTYWEMTINPRNL